MRYQILDVINATYNMLKYPEEFANVTENFIQSGVTDRWSLLNLFSTISYNSALGQSYENQFYAGRLFGNLTTQYFSYINGSSNGSNGTNGTNTTNTTDVRFLDGLTNRTIGFDVFSYYGISPNISASEVRQSLLILANVSYNSSDYYSRYSFEVIYIVI
jgi:hypothetical protein